MTDPRNPLADVETATIVRPGDRLIVTVREHTPAARIQAAAEALAERFPGIEHIVLTGVDVAVVPAEVTR